MPHYMYIVQLFCRCATQVLIQANLLRVLVLGPYVVCNPPMVAIAWYDSNAGFADAPHLMLVNLSP